MPKVMRRSEHHRHAAFRRFRRKLKRWLTFVAVIVLATYALNFFFSLGQYMPDFYQPKDFEREQLLKKMEEAAGAKSDQ